MTATTLASPCWVVYTNDGHEADGEWFRHHLTQADAEAALLESVGGGRDGRPPADLDGMYIRALAAPCVTLECDACGYVYDEGDEGVQHFADLEEVNETLGVIGWTADGEGRYRCGGDSDDETVPDPRLPGPNDVPIPGLGEVGG
jgi:hypothetical protein